MNRKRFAIHPGPVVSRNDGQTHHIGFAQLLALYHVPPQMCVDATQAQALAHTGLVHLEPRNDGNYVLWHRYEERLCEVLYELEQTQYVAHDMARVLRAHPIRWLLSRRYRKQRRIALANYARPITVWNGHEFCHSTRADEGRS